MSFVNRSLIEVERNLDRFECTIVTMGGKTSVNAGALVPQMAASILQVALPGVFTNFQVSSMPQNYTLHFLLEGYLIKYNNN